ncbi:MAG: bifunctional [glutamate--ammonia ligase]-adenylyl-L-tyrosine phosphorylase/[glutamate--ammonia-ligase] adenylyltransferase [Rhodospirillaceae bacterium]|nr:bifunctional [glutamate--ammonia ligase]-adenylyl-L-tyrosine phosphorylase/[glutamate--ammonia-ligase] adenylyltransferase [Rhodospirillaceae bacterium]
MVKINFIEQQGDIPDPTFNDRALIELESWKEHALTTKNYSSTIIAEILENPSVKELLLAIFGNSQFLTQSLWHEPEIFHSAVIHGLDETAIKILSSIQKTTFWKAKPDLVSKNLRIAKRRFSLLVAIGDISGFWSLDIVLRMLSDFADCTVESALANVLYQASLRGNRPELSEENPTKDSGIAILGMGKLGAKELNYSSDIDLIVLFDEKKLQWRSTKSIQHDLHRITLDLIKLLSSRTKYGYVFRTDLRLRPDAGASPLAVSTAAAERYYENLGQNWERAAMIKARAIAGDKTVANNILKTLIPFIWRKNLDFSAIQDIHSIKRQINAHSGHQEIAVAGHNIKVGRGGIREIEFYAQTQQLIWGGKDESLRARGTCDSLRALAEAGRTEINAANDLISAYYFLRHLEHRLQMVADEQTHTIPLSSEKIRHLSIFSGFNDTEKFTSALTSNLKIVETHYAKLFEESPSLGRTGNLVFTGTEDDPDTISTLKTMGFSDGSAIATTIRGWHHGRVKSTRSTRARELLTELMPQFLTALSETVDADSAFFHFNNFMTNLPSGVQLFSLFHANPKLLKLLAEVMGSAPSLAQQLSRNPELLDGLLTGDFYAKLSNKVDLESQLDEKLIHARDYEDILDITRRWTHETHFQIGMQLLRGIIDGYSSGLALTDVADVVLKCLLPHVEKTFIEQHGKIPGGDMGIVAMGKHGGRELTFLSDLDLIFIYKSPYGVSSVSDGHKPLLASQYFARLANRIVSSLNSLTSEGKLYDIDTRLRPSGNAGPIASELSGFKNYFLNEAWTWEHMALTRARFITGSKELAHQINNMLHEILCSRRDTSQLRKDVAEMRIKIHRERKITNKWKLQNIRGGLVDIEFITQYLQLLYASDNPDILSTETTLALNNLVKSGLLKKDVGNDLENARNYYKNIQSLLRLTVGMDRNPDKFPEALRERLIRQSQNTNTFKDVEDTLDLYQREVFEKHYKNIIE